MGVKLVQWHANQKMRLRMAFYGEELETLTLMPLTKYLSSLWDVTTVMTHNASKSAQQILTTNVMMELLCKIMASVLVAKCALWLALIMRQYLTPKKVKRANATFVQKELTRV